MEEGWGGGREKEKDKKEGKKLGESEESFHLISFTLALDCSDL